MSDLDAKVQALREAVVDYDGSQMVDGESPREGLTCGDIRSALALIDALQARLAEVERDAARAKRNAGKFAAALLNMILDEVETEGDWLLAELESELRQIKNRIEAAPPAAALPCTIARGMCVRVACPNHDEIDVRDAGPTPYAGRDLGNRSRP